MERCGFLEVVLETILKFVKSVGGLVASVIASCFLCNLFLGDLRVDWLDPWPETPYSAEFNAFYKTLEAFLIEKVDSVKIDETGDWND